MAHTGKYLYFNVGSGDGAAGDFTIFPVDNFKGFDIASGKLLMLFTDREGNAALDHVDLDVANTNQHDVIQTITKAIATMNAGVLTICDSDNSEFIHEKITDCTIAAVDDDE
tara:strand:+ start:199 stop:534 length:336 start_codon:yes stop_codon:yes gene_type:complete